MSEQPEYWRDEFWKGLNRLYDETLALKASIGKLHDDTVELRAATGDLRQGAEDLLKVAEAHQRVVERHQVAIQSHEKRLDRLDVLVQWLAEKERAREQQGPDA